MWPPDLAQQYERLRAQVVANEGERVCVTEQSVRRFLSARG